MSLLNETVDRRTTLLDLIGNTPLLRLARIAPDLPPDVAVYAKAEWYNPGGSVKDRPALFMIRDGERSGRLRHGMHIIDATSGNTGIAYATIGAALGYNVVLALPGNASPERKRILRSLGAELILTDPMEGTDGAIREVRARVAADPARYFYPDQYSNPANVQAHFETTGPEIWAQTHEQVTHFVAALGTSGTFVGVGHALRRRNSAVRLIAVQPDSPYHALEGVKHMESVSLVPAIYEPDLADQTLAISSEEAFAMARHLTRAEGLMVGISAAANVAAALHVARRLTSDIIMTGLCDSAAKYLSDRFWDEGVVTEGEGI
ncbi:MAG TPA: PLP-dependent cysteine synthase family protein [Roseiflexaceae bacterium]|nr:PLP-dependent cysteine synthase family protein [Roseiflexaceae bacterium]